ncbi:D-sedoheptulose 7-phosphate isomerase [Ectopseudomonas hydrolytica]|uniref:D-sedoheptulose 7-phosphate isomerase n=1 Tax=Ectopseudomonas hydrolytica TaxID=2493633 RepID=UPI003C2B4DE2
MIEHIRNSLQEAQRALEAFLANEQTLGNIQKAAELLIASFENKGKAFSCGNGGSMCDAMHFAEELTGRYRNNRPGIAAVSISDPSHISCVANDFGYDFIFSRYIESHGREGDVLIAISTSGKSPNVVKAAEAAKALGVKVIALTGKPGSLLESLADVCIYAPGGDYADRVQELHIKTLHILIELIERKLSPQNYA